MGESQIDATTEARPATLAGGWNRLARDLDRAIRAAKLEPAEAILWGEARELSWTAAKGGEALPFHLCFAEISRLHRIKRSWLSRVFKRMTLCGFFIVAADKGGEFFLINKDYRSWTWPDGSSRLTPEQVRWCRKAVRLCRRVPDRGHSRVPNRGRSDCNGASPIEDASVPDRGRAGKVVKSAPSPIGDAPGGCTKERTRTGAGAGARINSERERERVFESVCVNSATHTQTDDNSQQLPSQEVRPTDELALIREAGRILAGNLETEKLALDLLRTHNLPDLIGLEGWRFVAAARKQLGPTLSPSKRKSFAYFVTTARNLDESERDAPAEAGRPRLTRRQREEAARFAMLDALDLDAPSPNKSPGKEARP